MDKLLTAAIAIVISLAISGIGAITGGGSATNGGNESDELGCGDLSGYLVELGTAVLDHPTYTDWFIEDDSPTMDELRPAEAEDILADGEEFLNDITDIEPPVVYEDGHEGIIDIFTFFNETIAWVVLEEGDEPDTDDLSDALALIKSGEEAAADGCPDEVAELDGAVFINPDEIDTEDVPEDPGDVDKNFL
jgi:hypothetical protein